MKLHFAAVTGIAAGFLGAAQAVLPALTPVTPFAAPLLALLSAGTLIYHLLEQNTPVVIPGFMPGQVGGQQPNEQNARLVSGATDSAAEHLSATATQAAQQLNAPNANVQAIAQLLAGAATVYAATKTK